jgi:hypothetical protein
MMYLARGQWNTVPGVREAATFFRQDEVCPPDHAEHLPNGTWIGGEAGPRQRRCDTSLLDVLARSA